MKRPGYIERGIRPKHYSAGVEQIHIGFGHLRANLTIDEGLLPARHAPDDVFHGGRTGEGSALVGMDIELTKAVEEIIPAQLAHLGVNGEVGSGEWSLGA